MRGRAANRWMLAGVLCKTTGPRSGEASVELDPAELLRLSVEGALGWIGAQERCTTGRPCCSGRVAQQDQSLAHLNQLARRHSHLAGRNAAFPPFQPVALARSQCRNLSTSELEQRQINCRRSYCTREICYNLSFSSRLLAAQV